VRDFHSTSPFFAFPLKSDNPKRFTMKKNINPDLKAYANLPTRMKGKLARRRANCQKPRYEPIVSARFAAVL
jgi:hypothetical protein